jgi:hypothetical protein
MANIDKLRTMPDPELSRLQAFGRRPLIKLYSRLYEEITRDKELDDNEITLLDRIQRSFGLSREDVGYNERVLPFYYVSYVRRTNELPICKIDSDGSVVLKHDELPHYAAPTILRESRVVNLGYEGGSRGVSIRIVKGVYYKVGAHRGHVVKENQLVQTSAGHLVITNQRLFLVPSSGNKPVTIPLNKIHFYRCSENALEVYKEGREKGFFFILQSGDVEIFGICLSMLLQHDDGAYDR